MDIAEIKRLLEAEVPHLLRESPGFKDWLRDFVSRQSVSKESFDERFERMLKEFAADREEQRRLREEQRQKWEAQEEKWDAQEQRWRAQEGKWDEQTERWRAQEKKWDEQAERWRAQDKKWDEQTERWRAQDKKWDEQTERWRAQDKKWDEQAERWRAQDKKWDEEAERWRAQEKKWDEEAERWRAQERKWNENQEFLRAFARKYEQSIGALGARWGLASEISFRGALQGILQDSFGVQVVNVIEFDDEGLVFGRPDQVELDVIVKNGTLILCELKSSISKGDVFLFERKILYYEKRHQRSADRRIIVSPMVDPKALALAGKLGMEVFSFAEEVPGLA